MGDRPLVNLPMAGARPARADAVRNRQRILDAAEALFAEKGIANVSMDDVAAAAGVGKGTLYRRFGDRAGLAIALLDAKEAAFQEGLVRGEPPLGPGAPPDERLHAFLRGLHEHLDGHLDYFVDALGLGADNNRYRSGPYVSWHQHVALLISQIDPDADAELLAHQLLAPSDAGLYAFLRRERGMDLERILAGQCALANAIGG